MSKIRIFSKKAFAFGPGADRSGGVDSFVTVPNAFQEMDEKYTVDPTYKLAVVCGDVIPYPAQTVVSGGIPNVDVPTVETPVVNDNKEDTTVEEFYENLKIASKETTKELAEKYGAQFIETDSLKLNKKRVMEAYKLSIGDAE